MTGMLSAKSTEELLYGTTAGPWDDVRVGRLGNGTPRSHEEQVCGADEAAVVILTHDGSDEAHKNVRLLRAAPELAATVIALHADVDRLTAERNDARADCDAAYQRITELALTPNRDEIRDSLTSALCDTEDP